MPPERHLWHLRGHREGFHLLRQGEVRGLRWHLVPFCGTQMCAVAKSWRKHGRHISTVTAAVRWRLLRTRTIHAILPSPSPVPWMISWDKLGTCSYSYRYVWLLCYFHLVYCCWSYCWSFLLFFFLVIFFILGVFEELIYIYIYIRDDLCGPKKGIAARTDFCALNEKHCTNCKGEKHHLVRMRLFAAVV